MSTNDVPGAKKQNHDVLAMGCWAEHEDGSLIVVEGVEAGKVIYSVFDTALDPPVEYRDAMDENIFKRQFTWDPKAKTIKALQWTWHDKTPFPWEKVMRDFPAGERAASAVAVITAAQRVAQSLNLRAEDVRARQFDEPTEQRAARTIMVRMRDAVEALRS